ncbi:hypothetical protein [Candidatus Arsenophonus triatominarum]|uniref:hypothetical protein n=1 Tax=Candidatus Arsenophonus triatominarum TaxID=57911 RepID=UPI0007C4A0B2|nr:hypothetical protein [Candidatus Arsenophonus triatominarum]
MNKKPYFFNPNLSSEELEDWLAEQKIALAHYNNLKKERVALTKRLSEVDRMLERGTNFFKSDKLSFPWDPSPLLKVHQK